MPVNIVGGASSYHQISITSDEFKATAKSDINGKITCNVTPHSSLYKKLRKTKLPIPQLIRFILFVLVSSSKKALWLFILCVSVSALSLVYSRHNTSPVQSEESIWMYFTNNFYFIFIMFAFYYSSRTIASWHGAEHMVIASYCRLNSCDIRDIAQESPISDKCGGRFFLPLLSIIAVAYFVSMELRDKTYLITFFQLIAMECLLWVDKLVGLDKIRLTREASRLLQRYVTTKTPGQQELLTAQRAMVELVAAHNKTA